MPSRQDEIYNLQEKLRKETQSHLKQKADQTRRLTELTAEEKNLSEHIVNLKEKITSGNIVEAKTPSVDVSQLLLDKEQYEDKINLLQKELDLLKQKLSSLKIDSNAIDSKIEAMIHEKQEHTQYILDAEQQQSKVQRTSIKVKNEQQRNMKVKAQVTKQKRIYNNLQSFLKSLNLIEQIILNNSSLTDSKPSKSPDVSEEISQLIISAKQDFDTAQTKFDPNTLTPFLIDADRAYRNAITAFIHLTDEIQDSLLDEDFNNQVLTLVNKGLDLNTRHLNAVNSMLSKLEKGVEIAPLASFSNEIHEYFNKNLSILRITGLVPFVD
ncbi:MAG: hypothetical protein ACFE95_00480 [Candidatus Hodarchaeota archaeon]